MNPHYRNLYASVASALLATSSSLTGCSGSPSPCLAGYEHCACFEGNSCVAGLTCSDQGICVAAGSEGTGGELGKDNEPAPDGKEGAASGGDTGSGGEGDGSGGENNGSGGADGDEGADGDGGAGATGGTGGSATCTPGARACMGSDVTECSSEGSGTSVVESCNGTNVLCHPPVSACRGPQIAFPCTALPDENRHVSADDNSFNVVGRLYDESGSASSVSSVAACNASFSFAGTTDVRTEANWGVEVGIRLCQDGPTVHPIGSCPLGGNQSQVRGVRFTFCSTTAAYPTELRIHFPEAKHGYGAYKVIMNPASGTTHTIWMTDSDVRLWWDEEQPVDIPDVRTIGWTIPAQETPQSFEVCVSNVEILGTL